MNDIKKESGIVQIHGRDYITVAKRVNDFRELFPIADGWALVSDILEETDTYIRMKAYVKNPQGLIVADGYVTENKAVGVNKTSAVENAETSAKGRALASCGFAGTEFASSDEMIQNEIEAAKVEGFFDGLNYGMACYRHKEIIEQIKDRLADNDIYAAAEAANNLTNDELQSIWRAPTKGGIFTTEERAKMKSDEWGAAIRTIRQPKA